MAGIGAYNILVRAIPTTLTAGTTYYAIRNTDASKIVNITNIYLVSAFTGTNATTYSIFGVCRFSAATPTGGIAATIIQNDTTTSASAIGDARFAGGGLTTTGITFENYFMGIVEVSQVTLIPVHPYILNIFENPFLLRPGEGLAIQAANTIITGSMIYGNIAWYELPY